MANHAPATLALRARRASDPPGPVIGEMVRPAPGDGESPDARSTTVSNYLLKLYVTGQTPRTEKAIANLRRICEEDLHGRYELQIIDVLEDPQLAEDAKILATPR
jgi:hypothetical protein